MTQERATCKCPIVTLDTEYCLFTTYCAVLRHAVKKSRKKTTLLNTWSTRDEYIFRKGYKVMSYAMRPASVHVIILLLLNEVCLSYGFVFQSFRSDVWRLWGQELYKELPFDECWNAQTLVVNPLNDTWTETILQRLCSPAPQSYFVVKRAVEQQQQQQHSRNLSTTLGRLQYLVKPGYQWAEKIGDDTNFEIFPVDASLAEGWQFVEPSRDQQTTLEMAHGTLAFVSNNQGAAAAVTNSRDFQAELQDKVQTTKDRIQLTLGTDVRGRSSADAAFCFAMAGVTDSELYKMLATVASNELRRIGKRRSFRSKYILHMIEKLAAAGIISMDDDGDTVNEVYHVAADCLQFKGEYPDVVETLSKEFDLLSTRPLLWLWRFSSRQAKVAVIPDNDVPSYNPKWLESLDAPNKSLVVDIGCGMGVSLLGLATTSEDTDFSLSREGSMIGYDNWKDSNLVGCDLSNLTIGYAGGIANRWNLGGRLQFVCQPAQVFLEDIELHYPGKVSLVMIQFPSPYRFNDKRGGNKQLPLVDDGFMVSEELLRTAARILSDGGFLLLQSNVEDVAVTMQNLAQRVGFESAAIPQACTLGDFDDSRLSQRALEWIQAGGERAVGEDWSCVSLLPARGATETEVACHFQSTPVHRCLLRLSTKCVP